MTDIDKSGGHVAGDNSKKADEGQGTSYLHNNTGTGTDVDIDDAAAIPKGEIDPVYEAKARVLNRAAS
jgi:hypothetical protein